MSVSRVLVVTGTGTGIGKTHLAESMVRALRQTRAVIGWKPVESGVTGGTIGPDQARLTTASTEGSRTPGGAHLALREGISPHLAAEREGASLPWAQWMRFARSFARADEALVIELAGGLYSPLSLTDDNASFIRWLRTEVGLAPTVVLCAPDRLGVLHDVRAALLAAEARSLAIDTVVLIRTDSSDASVGTNARELERLIGRANDDERATPRRPLIVGPIPRDTPEALAAHPMVARIVSS